MESHSSLSVFRAVLTLTAACGVIACLFSLVPVFLPSAEDTPFLEPMFNTLTYLFSTGVGAVFGMLGSGKSET